MLSGRYPASDVISLFSDQYEDVFVDTWAATWAGASHEVTDFEIAGKDVLIVEDIIDSGLTLNYLMKSLRVRKPASIEIAALLVKRGIQRVPIEVKYPCFDIGPDFVIGYGLDYAGKYRNLPYVGVMEGDPE